MDGEDVILQREAPPCALCGGVAMTDVLDDVRDVVFYTPGAFTLARCDACALVQTRPRPTPAALARYYAGVYGRAFSRRFQVESPVGRLVPRYRVRVLRSAHALSASDRVLDVGCGYGAFLKAARDDSGCDCTGIDQEEQNIKNGADAEHIHYHLGWFDDVDLPKGSFSVVTMYHFLEHTTDPLAVLRRAHALLAPGGTIVVEVPSFDSWLRRVFGPAWLPLLIPQHLFHFTPGTLKRAVEQSGFTVKKQRKLFYPGEATVSLMFLLRRLLRLPALSQRSAAQRWLGLASLLLVALFGVVVEVPLMLLLLLLGRTGTQVVIAQKEKQATSPA